MARISNPFRFGQEIWDPSHRFETSWILSPWVLFGCRAAIVRLPSISNCQMTNKMAGTLRVCCAILHNWMGSDRT